MVPTRAATLGVEGHRPVVVARDGQDVGHASAVVNRVPAAAHTNTWGSPRGVPKKTGRGKNGQMPAGFAAHLRHLARAGPADREVVVVVVVIDNAPWHRGKVVGEAIAANPHLRSDRRPGYGPHLHPVERLGRERRRATHNQRLDTRTDLKTSWPASRSYFRAVRHKVKSRIEGRPKRAAAK